MSNKKITLFLALLIFTVSNIFSTFAFAAGESASPTPTAPAPIPTILPGECEGTIIPSFSFTNREVLKGFFLSLPDVASHFDVDNNGVFHVGNTTNDLSRFIISKPGYLSRTVDLPIGAAKNPIEMWAGDINEDGCINMSDIIIMGSGFNSESGSGNYNSICDFNQDQCINLSDIMIVASNFGKTRNDYPVYKAILY